MDLNEYLESQKPYMNDSQFARRIGVSTSLIGHLRKKNRDMSLSIGIKIEKFTRGKVKVEDLVPKELYHFEDTEK